MEIKQIDLYENLGIPRSEGASGGYLICYIHEQAEEFCIGRQRPAMIIAPGGAYCYISQREGEPVALAFLERGYNSFVLKYSIRTAKHPTQLIEGAMAIAYVKSHAAELYVDPDHVAMAGFSAGGHLAAMLATIYADSVVKETLGDSAALARPDAVVLSYPVITSDRHVSHGGSFDNLTGDNKELREYLSLEKRVDKDSVPAFIWCTADDDSVPSPNSMLLAYAYYEARVPFELHIFETGVHGLALANRETTVIGSDWLGMHRIDDRIAEWVDMAAAWLKRRGFEIIG